MKLGLIGFGNIATTLLGLLNDNLVAPLDSLTVLGLPEFADTTNAALNGEFHGIAGETAVVTDAAGLLACHPDLVVECAGHGAVEARGSGTCQQL